MSLRKIDLRLFDEGAVAGETSSDAGESSTAEGSSAEVSTTSEMSFDDFVEAHKDEYNKRVEGIVRQRIKDAKATKDNLTKAYSALDILAPKYKLEAGNYEGIINAIRSDKSILEEEALERGMSVEALTYEKQLKNEKNTLQAELESLREQQKEAKRREIIRNWDAQASEIKKDYPDFDLAKEVQNETFCRLIEIPGLKMKDAYEILHREERDKIVAGKTAQQISQNIAAKGHPQESGANPQQAFNSHIDISKLTKAEMDDYVMRARRGERITFT